MAGTNKMSELISLSTNNLRASPQHDNIFLDTSNTFNECNREIASQEVLKECPRIARHLILLYPEELDVRLKIVIL